MFILKRVLTKQKWQFFISIFKDRICFWCKKATEFLVLFTYRFVVIYECECGSPQTSKASWTPLFAYGWYWVSRPILRNAWEEKLVLKCASRLCQQPAAGHALHMPPTDDSQHPENLCFARSGAWDKPSCLQWGVKTMSALFHADYWPERKFYYFVRE